MLSCTFQRCNFGRIFLATSELKHQKSTIFNAQLALFGANKIHCALCGVSYGSCHYLPDTKISPLQQNIKISSLHKKVLIFSSWMLNYIQRKQYSCTQNTKYLFLYIFPMMKFYLLLSSPYVVFTPPTLRQQQLYALYFGSWLVFCIAT